MFEIEIIGLINKYRNSNTDFDKNKYKNSIKKLILENLGEFNNFLENSSTSGNLDLDTINFLKNLKSEIESENVDSNKDSASGAEIESDLSKIKQAYELWLSNFVNNNRTPNEQCESIVNEMINFYAPNRFYILKRVLEITDDNDFETFKIMLKNYIRKYFALKIQTYYDSESYKNLGFFEKRKKKKKILQVLEDMGNYKFDEKKILEAIN